MPETRWAKGRLCGFLELEEGKNNFQRKYFVLDKEAALLKIYFDHPNYLPKTACGPYEEIDLNFISKVSDARKARPKAGLCFSITIAGSQMYLQAESEDEMSTWIDTLNEACKITVPITAPGTVAPPNARNVVAGGVIVNSATEEEEGHEFIPPAVSLHSIMSGYATKQGAVRKNWKKRYFVLNEKGLSYYKSEMEREPIKTIAKEHIRKAKPVDKEHHAHRDYLFELITDERTFNIQCDTEKEFKQWVKNINKLIGSSADVNTLTYSEQSVFYTPPKPMSAEPTLTQKAAPRPSSEEEIEPNSRAVWKQVEPIQGDRSSKPDIRGSKKSWTLWSN